MAQNCRIDKLNRDEIEHGRRFWVSAPGLSNSKGDKAKCESRFGECVLSMWGKMDQVQYSNRMLEDGGCLKKASCAIKRSSSRARLSMRQVREAMETVVAQAAMLRRDWAPM